jgi:hypothetical protein
MEHNRKAAAANAHAAAASAKQAATSARLAEIDAKYARSGDLAGFLREVGAAGLTLVDLVDWLAAAGASGVPKFAAGDMPAKERPGEAIVPTLFNPWPEVLAMVGELLHEMRASRQQRKEQADRIAQLNEQVARLLQRWDGTSSSWRRYDGSAPSERA